MNLSDYFVYYLPTSQDAAGTKIFPRDRGRPPPRYVRGLNTLLVARLQPFSFLSCAFVIWGLALSAELNRLCRALIRHLLCRIGDCITRPLAIGYLRQVCCIPDYGLPPILCVIRERTKNIAFHCCNASHPTQFESLPGRSNYFRPDMTLFCPPLIVSSLRHRRDDVRCRCKRREIDQPGRLTRRKRTPFGLIYFFGGINHTLAVKICNR